MISGQNEIKQKDGRESVPEEEKESFEMQDLGQRGWQIIQDKPFPCSVGLDQSSCPL